MAKLYTEAALKKMKLVDLRKLADDAGYETEGEPKANLIEALLEVEDEAEAEVDDVEEDDEEVDEPEDLEEDDLELDEEEVELPAEAARQAARQARKDVAEAGMRDNDKPAGEKKTRAKRTTEPKVDANGKATLPAKQVATYLKTEAKVLRQFLRSDASTFEAVGSGGRYEFSEDDLPKIKSEFDAWKSAHASRGSKRGAGKAAAAEPIDTVDEIEEIEELDDEEAEIDDEEIDDDDLELED